MLKMFLIISYHKKLFEVCVKGIVYLTNMIAKTDTDVRYVYFSEGFYRFLFLFFLLLFLLLFFEGGGGGIFNEWIYF